MLPSQTPPNASTDAQNASATADPNRFHDNLLDQNAPNAILAAADALAAAREQIASRQAAQAPAATTRQQPGPPEKALPYAPPTPNGDNRDPHLDLAACFPGLIAVLDADGCIIQTNTRAQRVLDWPPDQLPGRDFAQIAFPDGDDRKRFRDLLINPDGAWHNLTCGTLHGPKTPYAWAVQRAEPGRRVAYGVLQPTNDAEPPPDAHTDLLASLLDTTHELLAVQDANSVYQSVSGAFARFVGRQPAQIAGCTAFDLLPPPEADQLCRMDACAIAARSTERAELNLTASAGTWRAEVIKRIVTDPAGEVRGVLTTIRPIEPPPGCHAWGAVI